MGFNIKAPPAPAPVSRELALSSWAFGRQRSGGGTPQFGAAVETIDIAAMAGAGVPDDTINWRASLWARCPFLLGAPRGDPGRAVAPRAGGLINHQYS